MHYGRWCPALRQKPTYTHLAYGSFSNYGIGIYGKKWVLTLWFPFGESIPQFRDPQDPACIRVLCIQVCKSYSERQSSGAVRPKGLVLYNSEIPYRSGPPPNRRDRSATWVARLGFRGFWVSVHDAANFAALKSLPLSSCMSSPDPAPF